MNVRRHDLYRVSQKKATIQIQISALFQTSYCIERLHSVPGELNNKEDGGHISVPDKSISSKFFCLGTPTWRL